MSSNVSIMPEMGKVLETREGEMLIIGFTSIEFS